MHRCRVRRGNARMREPRLVRQRLGQRVLKSHVQLDQCFRDGFECARLHPLEVAFERFELGEHAAEPIEGVELEQLGAHPTDDFDELADELADVLRQSV